MQLNLFNNNLNRPQKIAVDSQKDPRLAIAGSPFKSQLLKWVGNKQRYAGEIASYFPRRFGTYFEPFLGSGAVLSFLAPKKGVGSDNFKPLIDIWKTLKYNPETLKEWYATRLEELLSGEKHTEYENIKASYNANPNGADLLFLCRSCYGGVVRFRKTDGYMSTPCGPHNPISSDSFSQRVDEWYNRTKGTIFYHGEFNDVLGMAKEGDLVYCDPPYSHTQSILYGAQNFNLVSLFNVIRDLKNKKIFVALSIDGTKKSGNLVCNVPIPDGLFEQEILISCGRSMLRRFQMKDLSLDKEIVTDRLLLTY